MSMSNTNKRVKEIRRKTVVIYKLLPPKFLVYAKSKKKQGIHHVSFGLGHYRFDMCGGY
jgi:hypothetical protein